MAAALCLGSLLWVSGCPNPPPGDGTGNGNDNNGTDPATGDVLSEIVSFQTNFALSALDAPVSVIYTVTGSPDSISGLYVRVADASPGAGAIDDPLPLEDAMNLLPGVNQAFSFDPQQVGVGEYRIVIRVTVDGVSEDFLSNGVIQVQGTPEPRFVQPTDPITEVTAGVDVAVRFDAGDPEGDVQWRLFFLTAADSRDDPPDQLGTQLQTGSGNVGLFTFSTTGFEPGDYELGVSATDSGDSIATTVVNGELERIITIGSVTEPGPIIRVVAEVEPIPPTITILSPGTTDDELFLDQSFTIELIASVPEPGATGLIELFLDLDSNVANGFIDIPGADDLPVSTTSFPLPTGLAAGTYFVGASIRDSIGQVVTTYAVGTITVIRDAILSVTAPDTNLPIAPSDTISVVWTTNVPALAGSADVFAQTLDANGDPFGVPITVVASTSTATESAQFSSASSGVFEISVRITFNAEFGLSPLIDTAPQPVRVSSLPPILWLGSLAQTDPPFDGAILEGVEPEDNAGTVFTTAGDLDGDSLVEFVIVSRYGKPFFINPSGIGPGEAYLLYGATGAARLSGVYNLNSVGTSLLRGLTLTGVPTVGNTDDTDGLSDAALLPDSDGDGLDELAFGFPRTDSAGQTVGLLEAAGQFLSGGVIILSSNNSSLRNPTGGTSVIALNSVGQSFSDMSVVSGTDNILVDSLTFQAGDPSADPPTPDACVSGSDGVDDTVVGPSIGFIPLLAPPRYEQLGFTPIPEGTPPAEFTCVTQYAEPGCVDATPGNADPFGGEIPGSGFYPAAASALEPIGARIIGPGAGDGFGTSITHSNALGDDSPGDLIISAPNRTATVEEFGVNVIGFDITNSGVAMLSRNRNLWGRDNIFLSGETPPTPHQYVMRATGHCGDGRAGSLGQLSIAGDVNDNIHNIIGIDDFNGDGRNDFAVGAPTANGGQGRLYIAYRRDTALEGGFVLNKLELDPNDSERLAGLLVISTASDALGASLAGGFDFNGDGVSDLAVGSPNASGGTGEVLILFGGSGVGSGSGGISALELLQTARTSAGLPVAARITGHPLDSNGQFGFNVASAGDIDGDGLDDLLIAAPNATPRFDPDPTDGVDELTEAGVDVNFDGAKDDVSGPSGVPDGVSNANDNLENAGVVYVIFGRNRLDQIASADVTISVEDIGSNQLRGFVIAGRHAGDRLGGGDAGDAAQGGIVGKANRGRSRGLAAAGDVDGDGRADILIGAILADPRRDPNTGVGDSNGGEAYLIYGSSIP